MNENSSETLSADKPVTHPENDKLGVAAFAETVATSICDLSPSQGFVLALYGEWGSGKSTILEFIQHFVKQKKEAQRPIIIHFNPWWFSGQENLTKNFFGQLAAVLNDKKVKAGELKEKIRKFADAISSIPHPYAKPFKFLEKFLQAKDVSGLKADIEKDLREKNQKILIVIDDIDRLKSEEIRQVFGMIKSVADFPNVIYLLAFDKDIVVNALEKIQDLPGDAYLEKIVQVPFNIPLPDETSLNGLFFEKLNEVLDGVPEGQVDQVEWSNIFLDGIKHYIKTPRDIVRIINALKVTFPAVKDEVHPIDFVAIETIRVFEPKLYDLIRKNIESFTAFVGMDSVRRTGAALEQFHTDWLQNLGFSGAEEERIKGFLKRLFPQMESIWGNTVYPYEYPQTWWRERRVCAQEMASIFFRLSVPEGSISNVEINAIINLSQDPHAFGQKLLELASQTRPDGSTRVRALFDTLENYTRSAIPEENISPIIRALLDVGDELLRPEDEKRGFLGYGNDMSMGRIIRQLIKRLEEPQRFEILKQSILEGNALAMCEREVSIFGQQQGKYGASDASPEEEWIISGDHLEELEEIALEKIRKAAKSGELLGTKELPGILYSWKNWSDKEEPKQWVKDVINTNDGLLVFLETFLSKSHSHSGSDRVSRESIRLNPKNVEPFIDLDEINDRLRNLVDVESLSEKQQLVIKLFCEGYDWLQDGGDVDVLN